VVLGAQGSQDLSGVAADDGDQGLFIPFHHPYGKRKVVVLLLSRR
jgi:hypothetical protein